MTPKHYMVTATSQVWLSLDVIAETEEEARCIATEAASHWQAWEIDGCTPPEIESVCVDE